MGKIRRTTLVWTLGLTLVLAGPATAAKYINLIGTWSGPENYVTWDGSKYEYITNTGSLIVTDQRGGLFYGTIFGQPLTGNITGKNIIMTAYGWNGFFIINAKVTGKTIKGTFNYIHTAPFIETGNFTLIKG
jgi:hypothetical protein